MVNQLTVRPQLADSCGNLVEFGRDDGGESADYVIPAGGVKEGLAGKIVVLERTRRNTNNPSDIF